MNGFEYRIKKGLSASTLWEVLPAAVYSTSARWIERRIDPVLQQVRGAKHQHPPRRDRHFSPLFGLRTMRSPWEVLRMPSLAKAPSHVVIVDVKDHTREKLISKIELFEPDRFQSVN